MNAVWNSYGQLCGCPEIFKKSCKFFCRELDIRVNKIVDMAVEACEGKMPDMVMIPHGNCPEDAAYVAELVRKKMGVTNVMMNNLGPVIGGHTGAGMIAIVCMADHR